MDPESVQVITSSRVLAAMSHPVRRRLLDALAVDGPSTMLAARTGQASGNVVSFICLSRMLDHGPRSRGAAGDSLRRQIADGVRFIGRDPLIRPLTLFGGTANLALVGYQSLLVVFLVRTIGLEAGRVGLLLALAS